VLAAGDEPGGVRHPREGERLLDRARHAVQRGQPVGAVAGPPLVGGVGLPQRLVEAVDGDRVRARLRAAQRLDVKLDDLARRDLPGADRGGERDRRAVRQRLRLAGRRGHARSQPRRVRVGRHTQPS
jgi:hypothetical protein